MLGVVDRQHWKSSYVTPERSEVYPLAGKHPQKNPEFLMDRFPPVKKLVFVLKTFQSCVHILRGLLCRPL